MKTIPARNAVLSSAAQVQRPAPQAVETRSFSDFRPHLKRSATRSRPLSIFVDSFVTDTVYS